MRHIAGAFDGAIYCPECHPLLPKDDAENWTPIFESNDTELVGDNCHECQNVYILTEHHQPGEWVIKEEALSKAVRWATCFKCGHRHPCVKPSARERLEALKGEHQCPNCHGELHY